MTSKGIMTLRLDDGLAAQVELIAMVEGQPVSDLVRAAIRAHVHERRSDPAFQAAARKYLDGVRGILVGDE